LSGALVGDPQKLVSGGFGDSDSRALSFPQATFAVGLGAFGRNFTDCRVRYGEFLALSGIAACQPTDGTTVPDYVISAGALVPEVQVLYALSGKGNFSQLLRFEALPEPPGRVTLAELAETALELTGAETIGLAMVAESAGLVGAALKQSPANLDGQGSPLGFPAVRDWLSFTADRAFDRTLVVVVGAASRATPPVWAPLLRPIGPGTGAAGHFHAAVFPYRPLQRGELSLHPTVNALFGSESILGLLHLLADDREIEGVGQSDFLRGACWFGPFSAIRAYHEPFSRG
jgi:hypothetical protein